MMLFNSLMAVLLYLSSAVLAYIFVREEHIDEGTDPSLIDIFLVGLPIYNSIVVMFYTFMEVTKRSTKIIFKTNKAIDVFLKRFFKL